MSCLFHLPVFHTSSFLFFCCCYQIGPLSSFVFALLILLTQRNCLTCHKRRNRKHKLVSDHIFSAMDKKKIVAMVLIDLSIAFDSLCHSPLLCKLQNLGTSNKQTTDNSLLVLQLHCQNHSLSHMAYLKAQFSAQRFSTCT